MSVNSGVSSDLLQHFLDAASRGDSKKVTMMLKHRPELLNQRGERGWGALMLAARNGQLETAQILLKHRCDTSVMNSSGQTARDVALFWGHTHISRLLSSSEVPALSYKPIQECEVYFNRPVLDRMSQKRSDSTWISKKLTSPGSVFLLFDHLSPLVRSAESEEGQVHVCKLRSAAVQEIMENHQQKLLIFLGVQRHRESSLMKDHEDDDDDALIAWFAIGIEEDCEGFLKTQDPGCFFLQQAMPGLLRMSDEDAGQELRITRLLSKGSRDAGVVAQARSVLAWHSRYQFCPTCGSKTKVEDSGYKRTCLKAACSSLQGIHNTSYPRVDPVVIMLVLHPDGNQCLLGRKKVFPPGMFSCLAGFVEPGESIEAAVRREVQEESSVQVPDGTLITSSLFILILATYILSINLVLQVGAVQYLCSQVWPMPSCLMIGCICVAMTMEINPDQDEIEEARWFTRQQVIEALVKDKRAVFSTPPNQTVAHQLIKHWIGFNSNL
ncbi:hypothetical protein DNTS_004402 [Danionella cerebrum]|uniref:NAD(+) diphosphatase n=1 Tax=Danionella cerebrum TaxID=2873325 RepID=A0A553NH73_9TELE|nr:hypothetical protein DNTS_004402 [Danionella translucida]